MVGRHLPPALVVLGALAVFEPLYNVLALAAVQKLL